MRTPPRRSLGVQIDLHGWSVSIPHAQFSAGETFTFFWHLVMGLAFSVAAGTMGLGHYNDGGREMIFFGAAALFSVLGIIMSAHALLRLMRNLLSTHLLVSGGHLQIEQRLLGRRLWPPQRLMLKDLGPVSFSKSSLQSRLCLGEGIRLPAFVEDAYQGELTRVLEDSIKQARARPDIVPKPPVQLQNMLQQVSSPSSTH